MEKTISFEDVLDETEKEWTLEFHGYEWIFYAFSLDMLIILFRVMYIINMIATSGSLVLEAELYGNDASEVRWRGEFTAQCNLYLFIPFHYDSLNFSLYRY